MTRRSNLRSIDLSLIVTSTVVVPILRESVDISTIKSDRPRAIRHLHMLLRDGGVADRRNATRLRSGGAIIFGGRARASVRRAWLEPWPDSTG